MVSICIRATLAQRGRIGDDAWMRAATSALLFLCLAGASPPARSPVGHYRLVGEHDVASELILQADGYFQYALAAGALDEQAEGSWTREGDTVFLTTEPKPRPAVFAAGATARTSETPLNVKVIWPNGRGAALIDLRVGFDGGEPAEGYTQDYGWSLSPDEKRVPRWIEFALPMYQLQSQRFTIDAAKANDLTFVLTPNDLGTVDFERLPLTIGDRELVMHRYGGELTYLIDG